MKLRKEDFRGRKHNIINGEHDTEDKWIHSFNDQVENRERNEERLKKHWRNIVSGMSEER